MRTYLSDQCVAFVSLRSSCVAPPALLLSVYIVPNYYQYRPLHSLQTTLVAHSLGWPPPLFVGVRPASPSSVAVRGANPGFRSRLGCAPGLRGRRGLDLRRECMAALRPPTTPSSIYCISFVLTWHISFTGRRSGSRLINLNLQDPVRSGRSEARVPLIFFIFEFHWQNPDPPKVLRCLPPPREVQPPLASDPSYRYG